MPKTEMIAIRPIDRDRQAKKLSREEKCRAELSTVPGTPPATPWTSSARDRRSVISLSNFPNASATLTELSHHGSKTNRTRPPRIVSPYDLNIPAVLVMCIRATTHSSTRSCGGHRPSISCSTRTPTAQASTSLHPRICPQETALPCELQPSRQRLYGVCRIFSCV
jgi:hypothetical protein